VGGVGDDHLAPSDAVWNSAATWTTVTYGGASAACASSNCARLPTESVDLKTELAVGVLELSALDATSVVSAADV
jgi:hypothetical protein